MKDGCMDNLTSPDDQTALADRITDHHAQWREASLRCVAAVRLEAWDDAREWAEAAVVQEALAIQALRALSAALQRTPTGLEHAE
jgi:hypothetical protein